MKYEIKIQTRKNCFIIEINRVNDESGNPVFA